MANYIKGQILYQKDKPDNMIRIVNYESGANYKCLQNGKIGYLSIDPDKWVALNPDALLTVATVLLDDNLRDVIVSVFKNGKKPDALNPDIVCRQCVNDIFAIMDGNKNKLGISISQITSPNDMKLEQFMAFRKHSDLYSVMVYSTDTLDDIIKVLRVKRPDTFLRHAASMLKQAFPRSTGICETLKELLETNEFMRDFHALFGIIEVPFSLRDRELVPMVPLAKIVASELHKTPEQIYVTKYDRSVDLNQIKRPYVLATADSSQAAEDDRDIYIVAIDENEQMSWSDFVYQDEGGIEGKLKSLGW